MHQIIESRLGEFKFLFEKRGKLFQLELPRIGPVLYNSDYEVDLGDGRTYRLSGWDECFPTIERFGTYPPMGSLVDCEPTFEESKISVKQTWSRADYVVLRRFSLISENRLEVTFRVKNTSKCSFNFLWASHALLALDNTMQLHLPDGALIENFGLDGTAHKRFLAAERPFTVVTKAGEFSLSTDQPFWGLWLNLGGWPAGEPAGLGCVGVEATNTAADFPQARNLEESREFVGRVSIEVAS
jgi:hypothetical protein